MLTIIIDHVYNKYPSIHEDNSSTNGMAKQRTIEIQQFIIDLVRKHPGNIASEVVKKFGISRQATNKHFRELINKGVLSPIGNTKARRYELNTLFEFERTYPVAGLEEDIPWTKDIRPNLNNLRDNVSSTLAYVFTEILNNAIDHSNSENVTIKCTMTAATIDLSIIDQGVGIFRKIKDALKLTDERQAILELSKGKLTTDSMKHSGEGIFFSSRAVDLFCIWSGNLLFRHFEPDNDWLVGTEASVFDGTYVKMTIATQTSKSLMDIFAQYQSSPEDMTFSKTHVPISLAQFGPDSLISRSQARRVLARLDGFKEVLLDFTGVPIIGQGFADEIFRVFSRQNPGITIRFKGSNDFVRKMIQRALGNDDHA